ncbi:MAG: tetratricopeptide repeat protein, partial [Clostridium sp.]
SHRQMQDDDVIMPPSYKENTGWQSVLNIGAGLLLGAVAVFFLIMPAKEKTLNTVHNQEILQYNEQLNQKNGEIKSLNDNMAQYVSDKTAAEDKLNELLNSNDSMVNQYAILVKMLQAYRENDLAGAVALYGGFNPSLFTDEAVLGIANGLKQDIETNGYQSLEDLAYTMWSAGRLGEALTYYQTCLNIRPANPKVLFNMGMINRAQNQTDTAIQLFTQVSTQFGDSEYAEKARAQLAELQPQGQPAAAAAPPLASIINPTTAAAPTEAAPIESAPTEAAPAA